MYVHEILLIRVIIFKNTARNYKKRFVAGKNSNFLIVIF